MSTPVIVCAICLTEGGQHSPGNPVTHAPVAGTGYYADPCPAVTYIAGLALCADCAANRAG